MPFLYIILGLAFVAEGVVMLSRKKKAGTEDDPLATLRWVDKQLDDLSDGKMPPALETRIREIVKDENRKEPPRT